MKFKIGLVDIVINVNMLGRKNFEFWITAPVGQGHILSIDGSFMEGAENPLRVTANLDKEAANEEKSTVS